MPGRRRILQEAKASGKAWGYADVKTTCSKDKAVSSSQVVNTSDLESNEWAQTPWRKLEQYVFQLQKRIYRARQRGDWKTVRGLQRLLRRSRAARTLAVRRVTQDNSGKKTPGIDGVAKLSPKERLEMVQTMNLSDKARPVRRVWIPKPGKTEMRPLGIPTMMDRAKQALEFISIKSLVTKASGAPGNCAGRNRAPSPDHGPLASTGGSGPSRCGSA